MGRPELMDRRVVRVLARRQHPDRHILVRRLGELSRRRDPDGVPVEQQRRHHPGRIRPLPAGILALDDTLDRAQVQLLDQLEHEIRQMVLR